MDYQTLSDKDLIQRYCAIQSDQSAFGELWRRYEPTLRKYARHLTFMCPHFYSRDLFFEEVFSTAQERVARGVHGYEGRVTFSGWLWSIADRAAIDHRRKILGRGSEPRELVEFTEEELVQRGAVFGDKIRQDPMHHAVRSERKAMLDDIMGRHAASEEGYRSISAIIFNVLYDYTVRQVAEILGTYERDIFRLFKADYPRLRAALAARGIRCVRDALTSQE